MQKILYLSVIVLALIFLDLSINNANISELYEVSVYIEGDMASLMRVADLSVDYNKNNLSLVSSEAGGFLVGSSLVKKDHWEVGRSLLMSTVVDQTKPILRFKFKSNSKKDLNSISISPNSSVYLSNIGSATLFNDGLSYRIKYE